MSQRESKASPPQAQQGRGKVPQETRKRRRRRFSMRRTVVMSVGTLSSLLALAVIVIAVMLGMFLHTLSALTRETVVAEVIMWPIQEDEQGRPYIDILFNPLQFESALEETLDGDDTTDTVGVPGETQPYRIYGDTVAVRGPLIALHPALILLNFESIYKLSLIEGEYRRSGGPTREGSEIPINGGFDDSWWNLNSNEAIFPYNLIVRRMTFSGDEEPGFFGEGRKRYEIVVTPQTITWNFIENLDT